MSKPAHIAEREKIVDKNLEYVTRQHLKFFKRMPSYFALAMNAVAADVQIATYKRLGHTMPKLEVTPEGDVVEVKNASNL